MKCLNNQALGEFIIEKLDVYNEEHLFALSEFRDKIALDMCYDVMNDVDMIKTKNFQNENCYLIKNEDGYFCYLCISVGLDTEKELSYIIKESSRKKGLATTILNSISNLLLIEDIDTTSVILSVKPNNIPGIKLATKCGFIEDNTYGKNHRTYKKQLAVKRN